jgi:hypothetical protein
LSLTACSDQPESAAPGVATIKSATASAPPRERPILRPDAEPGERDRLIHAYGMCLHDQGIPTSSTAAVIVKATVDLTLPEYADKAAACADKEPQYWMDLARQTDPEFLDKLRAEAACLTTKGWKVKVAGDPTTIQFGSEEVAARAMNDENACEREAFAY